jgi:hypothetical protein
VPAFLILVRNNRLPLMRWLRGRKRGQEETARSPLSLIGSVRRARIDPAGTSG